MLIFDKHRLYNSLIIAIELSFLFLQFSHRICQRNFHIFNCLKKILLKSITNIGNFNHFIFVFIWLLQYSHCYINDKLGKKSQGLFSRVLVIAKLEQCCLSKVNEEFFKVVKSIWL